jgi:hypothetical protein
MGRPAGERGIRRALKADPSSRERREERRNQP